MINPRAFNGTRAHLAGAPLCRPFVSPIAWVHRDRMHHGRARDRGHNGALHGHCGCISGRCEPCFETKPPSASGSGCGGVTRGVLWCDDGSFAFISPSFTCDVRFHAEARRRRAVTRDHTLQTDSRRPRTRTRHSICTSPPGARRARKRHVTNRLRTRVRRRALRGRWSREPTNTSGVPQPGRSYSSLA